MNDFQFQNTTKVYFGKHQLQHLHQEVLKYGQKVLIADGGEFIRQSPLYAQVLKELTDNGIQIFELGSVEPNPRHTTVNRGVKLCKGNNIQTVLAVGGGSTIDCCKAIAATSCTDEDDVWTLIEKREPINQALAVIAMPTIASTGSEMDKSCVIANEELHLKKGLNGEAIRPKAAFLNPENTFTVPARQTACGGFDIMMHLLDMNYFVDSDKYPLQFNVVETLLRTIREQLPIALREPENYEARATLLWGASWALNSFCTSGFKTAPSNHGLEQFSAFYDQTHGLGLALVVTKWMTYLLEKDPTVAPDFARLGTNVLGCQPVDDVIEGAKNAIKAFDAFIVNDLGLPRTMTEIGLNDSKLSEMAHAAVTGYGDGTLKGYRELTEANCLAIYKMCL
ncbi:iron-containing alcohol dehydrogenase [Streptococcus gallolyticus]|uniref:NADH-dependent butanol dehydrogenase A n=1 Tax=Streptococcus gallolyticus TaxID=315405 RepID=A0A139QQT1_9STRE|nr:iron-containing alcohol dehydrogenase [Streptococcus gallolyticus]KXU04842.1 NADH-dependent butanol dehydrogenase A [Streptococcus gallolyticus]